MSDMKLYESDYSYEGIHGKKEEDGTRSVKVKWFVYDDTYYKPKEPLQIILRDEKGEEEDWTFAECEEAGIRIGGRGIEEVLGNAFMMAVDQYEHILNIPDEKATHVRELKNNFNTWEVHSVGSKAQ